jgi:hypothetical protein
LSINQNSQIVKKYKIGAVLNKPEDIHYHGKQIKNEYNKYQNNLAYFLNENSWDKSVEVHREAFK